MLHNGERVSNKILVFFVIPYKIEVNLSPYPCKNCSEASKHVNFQLQKFTISITHPKISIFSALTFLFLQKMTKKPFGSTESKDLHFDDDGDLRG